jgi:hypothetical protein
MQLELTTTQETTLESHAEVPNWSKAFNTSILSTSIDSKCLDSDLELLLATPEYAAILLAAQSLAEKLQLSPEAATERLIQNFRSIDSCWGKILLKKGAQSLLGL